MWELNGGIIAANLFHQSVDIAGDVFAIGSGLMEVVSDETGFGQSFF